MLQRIIVDTNGAQNRVQIPGVISLEMTRSLFSKNVLAFWPATILEDSNPGLQKRDVIVPL